MTDYLKENEKIDDLQRCGLKIIQNPGKFCFGMDAVLLSGFMKVKRNEPAIDLGTGTGIIPILLTAKTEGVSFTGLEIQKDMADMARRSVEMNGLLDKVKIVNGDIKEADKLFGKAAFGVVSSLISTSSDSSASVSSSATSVVFGLAVLFEADFLGAKDVNL